MTRRFLILPALLVLAGCRPALPPPPPPDPAVAEVRAFLENYFAVWSANNMEAYGSLFAPEATVQVAGKGSTLRSLPLGPFLDGQRAAQAARQMSEAPLSVDVRPSPDGRAAQATVRWRLVDGERSETGWDHFTLLRRDGGWRIVHLLFYQE